MFYFEALHSQSTAAHLSSISALSPTNLHHAVSSFIIQRCFGALLEVHPWRTTRVHCERLLAASLQTGAVQEVDHASPGLSVTSNRSAVVSTHHCDGQWIVPPSDARGIGYVV